MPTALSKVIALGYGLAAIVYLVLAIILVASGRLRSQSHLLVLACALTGLWAVMATIDALNAGPSVFGLLLETARDAAWLALLLYILHLRLSPLPAPLRTVRVIGATLTGALLLALLAPLLSSPVLTDARPVHLGLLGMTVLGLVLVEQVYRSTRQEDRWAIKFLCLGLGTLFVFDFYLYANSALFQATSLDVWGARGYVIMLTAPLVAISAARNPQWSAPVGLSRNMVFHTVSLLGAGVYLLLMAAAGYYLKVFGGNWGNVIQAAFVFSALLLLGLILFSGTWRARLRVFVNKHFFSYRYDYREEWLKFTRTLSSGAPGERLCEHAIESLAQLVDSPGGALWLKEETYAYQRAAHWNWSEIAGREPLDSAFIAWLRQKQWVIDLQELQETPEHYPDLLLPEWLARTGNAWLVIPLMQHDDMLGFIVLKPSLVKISFNWEVGDLLKVAARQATTHLAQMQAANALIVARQFESFNRTTTFVIHDLKNLVAQLSLLLSNAEKHKHKPEFQADVLETVESAVARMNKVLAQLLRGSVSETSQQVSLGDILSDAAASKRAFKLQPVLSLPPTPLRVCADRERLTRVIGHILQNALEATPANGHVSAALQREGNLAVIEIGDSGSGMDETFIRNRLFQPFHSTKGAGMGIGAYEARETFRTLGGNIEVASTPGHGTVFRLTLPLASGNNPGSRRDNNEVAA